LELRRAAKELKRLADDIRGRLAAGASVEPGPYTAWLQEVRQQRLTNDVLVEALGQEFVQGLKERARPTVCRRLVVTEARTR
jgi:hypothetical protein